MYQDLTKGSITRGLLLFALPMVAGKSAAAALQHRGHAVGRAALGRNALAAVGSAFTLMTFLTSIFLGLSMGAGALFSIYLGRKDHLALRSAVAHAFVLIAAVTLVLNLAVYLLMDPILHFLQIPPELYASMREYLWIIFAGLPATFLYNFSASLLRSAGNSVAPLWFLGASALLNIGLDLLFVLVFHWGVAGAAVATVIAQYLSGVGLGLYVLLRCRELLPRRSELRFSGRILRELLDLSLLTCAQQSAMNFGILLVQRLVDSFGPGHHGRFCGGCEDRRLCISSSPGLRQRILHVCSPKLRRGAGGAAAGGRAKGNGGKRGLFLPDLRGGGGFCPAPHAHLCAGGRYRGAGGRSALPAGGGRLLCGHWVPLSLYGFSPGCQTAGMSVVLTVISWAPRVALAYALAGQWERWGSGWRFLSAGSWRTHGVRILSPAPAGSAGRE